MRDGLVPCLALRLPETIKYHAGLSFFIESFGERGASCLLARRRSPGPHLVLSSRHLPLPSSRSAALATGQGARTGLLLQRAKVNVVERATQLHGLCVRCGHRVHSGALSWIAPQGWVKRRAEATSFQEQLSQVSPPSPKPRCIRGQRAAQKPRRQPRASLTALPRRPWPRPRRRRPPWWGGTPSLTRRRRRARRRSRHQLCQGSGIRSTRFWAPISRARR